MSFRSRAFLLLFLLGNVVSARALAWGERGHDLIARVASRLVMERAPEDDGFAPIFFYKEHVLGHLANVPDIVWRAMGKEIEDENGPTHYVDLEFVEPKARPELKDMPLTVAALEAKMKALCAAPRDGFKCPPEPTVKTSGSAPFRVQQLWKLMTGALAKAKDAKGKELNAAVDEALLYGGVMAHFVGDLANPWHTTDDYNGYATDQGGVHKYFEDDVVNVLDLRFDQDVLDAAMKGPAPWLAKAKDPLELAWSLTLDSNARLASVRAMDAKLAVTKKGSSERGMHIKAERKDPKSVRDALRPVLVERMAAASGTLARLWTMAWESAGKPDLRSFQSYTYPHAPAFVKVDYLTAVAPETATPAPAVPQPASPAPTP